MSSRNIEGGPWRISRRVGNVEGPENIPDLSGGVPVVSLHTPDAIASLPVMRAPKSDSVKASPEMNPELSKPQELTAQIVYSAMVLDRLASQAKEELPGLKRTSVYKGNNPEETPSDEDIVIQRVAGLLDGFRLHFLAEEGKIAKDDLDELHNRFHERWENSADLLDRSKEPYDSLQKEREEIYKNAAHTGSWKQRAQRFGAKVKTRRKLGGSDLDMLYDLTDTTIGQEKGKSKAWAKTLAASAVSEGASHVGGAIVVGFNLQDHLTEAMPGFADTDSGRFFTALALNVALWGVLFGANARENTRMLLRGGTSTTPLDKAMLDSAEYKELGEKDLRKRALLGNRLYHFGWEIAYLAEAAVAWAAIGGEEACAYWGGAALGGLIKNVGQYAVLRGVNDSEESKASEQKTKDLQGSGDLTPDIAVDLPRSSSIK